MFFDYIRISLSREFLIPKFKYRLKLRKFKVKLPLYTVHVVLPWFEMYVYFNAILFSQSLKVATFVHFYTKQVHTIEIGFVF